MTVPVAENSPAPAGVAEPASPIHAARTIINILCIEADPDQLLLDSGDLRPLKSIYRYVDYGPGSRLRCALTHV